MEDKIKELHRLEKKNGGHLLPEKVIEAARAENSPLHDEFEWDDSIAAHKHRIEQAEHLIRRYRITYKDTKAEERQIVRSVGQVPEYSPHPQMRGYFRTSALLAGPERKNFLLAEYHRCEGHVQRFCGYLREADMETTAGRVEKVMQESLSQLNRLTESEAGC